MIETIIIIVVILAVIGLISLMMLAALVGICIAAAVWVGDRWITAGPCDMDENE